MSSNTESSQTFSVDPLFAALETFITDIKGLVAGAMELETIYNATPEGSDDPSRTEFSSIMQEFLLGLDAIQDMRPELEREVQYSRELDKEMLLTDQDEYLRLKTFVPVRPLLFRAH
jgi:hypothetical protein